MVVDWWLVVNLHLENVAFIGRRTRTRNRDPNFIGLPTYRPMSHEMVHDQIGEFARDDRIGYFRANSYPDRLQRTVMLRY